MSKQVRIMLVAAILLMVVLPAIPIYAQRTLRQMRLNYQEVATLTPMTVDCPNHWDGTQWVYSACTVIGGIYSYATTGFTYSFPPSLRNIHIVSVYWTGACRDYPARDSTLTIDGAEFHCTTDGAGHATLSPDIDMTGSVISGYGLVWSGRTTADPTATVALYQLYVDFYADDYNPTALVPPAGVDGICKVCNYSPVGDWFEDAPNLVNFLACQLGNIYFCVVVPILLGIWKSIIEVITLIQSMMYWFISAGNQAALWVNGNIVVFARFTAGTIDNAATTSANAIYSAGGTTIIGAGGSNANLFDVLIEFIRTLGATIGKIADIFPSLIGALRDVSLAIVNGIVTIATLLINLVLILVNVFIVIAAEILRFASIIPYLVVAFSDGFGATTSSPLAPASMPGQQLPLSQQTILGQPCTDDPYFTMCLGVYVMDNTIFDESNQNGFGVVGLMNFVKGIAVIGLMLWGGRKMTAAFSGGSDNE